MMDEDLKRPPHRGDIEWGQVALLALLTLLLLGFARQHHPLLVAMSFGSLVVYHFWGERLFVRRSLRGWSSPLHMAGYLLLCSFVIWVTTTPEEESFFWLVFLLPVVIAGARFGLFGTSAVAAAAAMLYFLLLPEGLILSDAFAEELPEFLIISAVFFFVGLLVQTLSQESRRQLSLQQEANRALEQSLVQLEAAEENLRRQDRLAALGEMAAGVAHEIRNPLGIVSASAQLLGRKLATKDPDASALADAILEETTRLSALITEFLAFGREPRLNRRMIRLADLLRGSVEGFRDVADRHGVSLRLSAEVDILAVLDADLLQQVLLNLFLNAVDAMPEGGEVAVFLTDQGERFTIEVRDTGHGIPEEYQEKIFNPFFTTREKGTGLGLANAHKFVAAQGGRLSLACSSPQGSAFILDLPKGIAHDGTHSGR